MISVPLSIVDHDTFAALFRPLQINATGLYVVNYIGLGMDSPYSSLQFFWGVANHTDGSSSLNEVHHEGKWERLGWRKK